LELVVRALFVLALVAGEQVRGGDHVLRDHVLFALVFLFNEGGPLDGVEFLVAQKAHVFGRNTLEQPRRVAQIVQDGFQFGEVHVVKKAVAPFFYDEALLARAHHGVEHALLHVGRVVPRDGLQFADHVGPETGWVFHFYSFLKIGV